MTRGIDTMIGGYVYPNTPSPTYCITTSMVKQEVVHIINGKTQQVGPRQGGRVR